MNARVVRRRMRKSLVRQPLLTRGSCCEPLESRYLLSAIPDYAILPNFSTAPSSAIALVATQPTVTSLVASPSPSQFGDPVLIRAFIQPGIDAVGTVSFFDNSMLLGTAPVDASGHATLTVSALAVGSHSITAEYSGNDTLQPSTSQVLTLPVGRASV